MDPVGSRRPVPDEALQLAATGSDSETETYLRQLLAAYDDILRTVERLGTVVRVRGRSDGPLGRHWRWRFRWLPLTRYFIVQHIARNLAALLRHYHVREALSNGGTDQDQERSRVESFQKSLPIVPTRRLVVLVAIGWAAVSFTIAYAMSVSAPIAGLETPRVIDRSVSALALAMRTTVSNLNLAGGLPVLFEQIMTDWYTALSFVTLLVASLYVLLLVPVSAYRLKRILFNSQATGEIELTDVVSLRHRTRREGLFSLEAQLFHALGLRQPREIQWDMFIPLLPFAFLVLILGINMPSLEQQEGAFAYAMLILALLLFFARLSFLLAISRRRRSHVSLVPSSTSRRCPNCGYWIPVQAVICDFCSFSFALGRCVRMNPSAIASLLCGMGGVVAGGLFAAIPALFLSVTATRQIRESGGLQQGLTVAKVGAAFGFIAILIPVAVFLLW